jgi:hypothetical protein
MLGGRGLPSWAQDRRSVAEERSWLETCRAFGELDLPQLLGGGWPSEHVPATVIDASLLALSRSAVRRPVLALIAADSLVKVSRGRFDEPEALLWTMRAAAQTAPELTLLLAGGPATPDLIQSRDAAFYGWGRPVALARLDVRTLANAIRQDLHVDHGSALRVAELSEGLPRVARLVARWLRVELDEFVGGGDPVSAAWMRLIDDQASSLRTSVRLLADLHRVALPVCQALAAGRPPYTAGRSGEVTRALKLLRAHGVCETPRPRTWRLSDPVLAAWIKVSGRVAHHQRPSDATG